MIEAQHGSIAMSQVIGHPGLYQGLSKTHQQELLEARKKFHCQRWATVHPCVLLTKEAAKGPKTIVFFFFASAVDYQLEPDVKSLLLNTSQTWLQDIEKPSWN